MEMKIDFPGGKKVSAHFHKRSIHTDQPISSGGDGTAPAPFDLFLASIGTCAGLYVLAFCDTRKIPTDELSLTLTTKRDPEKKLITQMDIAIHLPPEFPEKYYKAVIKAAEYCAVTRHMYDPPTIVLNVVPAE